MTTHKIIATTLLTFTSSFAIATTQLPTPPQNHFDCGALNDAQTQKIENETSSDGLKDLAKTCEEQATTFQTIALQAANTLPQKDLTDLYNKAANAHARVASFTNTSLFKN